jgi:hypothetical protein
MRLSRQPAPSLADLLEVRLGHGGPGGALQVLLRTAAACQEGGEAEGGPGEAGPGQEQGPPLQGKEGGGRQQQEAQAQQRLEEEHPLGLAQDLALWCDLLVVCHPGEVDAPLFECLNGTGVVYDGVVVVDGGMRTSDPRLLAAGPAAKLSRRYGRQVCGCAGAWGVACDEGERRRCRASPLATSRTGVRMRQRAARGAAPRQPPGGRRG